MRTRKIVTLIAATIFGLAAVVVSADEVQAYTPAYVEDHTGAAWPVNYSQGFVDQYTGTDIIYGSCRAGAKCVRVYEFYFDQSISGLTCLPNEYCRFGAAYTDYFRIYLNSYRNNTYSYNARRNITTHELGHAFGIGYHSVYCTNVMYGSVFCPDGSLPTYRFTDPQKAILGAN